MGDMSEGWDQHKAERQIKKRSNANRSAQLLIDKGIVFTSHNNGIHLVVEHHGQIVDFWPSTGKFIFRTAKTKGRGVFNLVKQLER